MTPYILSAVGIVLLGVAAVFAANWVEAWAERRYDRVEPPSNLDRWDWGGDR